MGFYPKHLRQRKQRQNNQLIVRAALAGCMFISNTTWRACAPWTAQNGEYMTQHLVKVWWCDALGSMHHDTSKAKVAAIYLIVNAKRLGIPLHRNFVEAKRCGQ